MRHFSLVLAFVLAGTAVSTPSSAQSPVDDATLGAQFQQTRKYQVTIGYSNDNVILSKIVDAFVEDGIDDYVTTAFWGQLVVQNSKRRWFVDAGLDVLTNREAYYRADLVTIRTSSEMPVQLGLLRVGAGLAARGRFGGSTIQNTYHNLTSIPTVELPYVTRNVIAPQFDVGFTSRAIRTPVFATEAYASASYATAAGPSKADAGVVVACCSQLQGRSYSAQVQLHFGYVGYYSLDDVIAPMFGQGFTSGLLASVGRKETAEVAFWITRNQFGVDNLPQFGMAITVGWNGIHSRIHR